MRTIRATALRQDGGHLHLGSKFYGLSFLPGWGSIKTKLVPNWPEMVIFLLYWGHHFLYLVLPWKTRETSDQTVREKSNITACVRQHWKSCGVQETSLLGGFLASLNNQINKARHDFLWLPATALLNMDSHSSPRACSRTLAWWRS